jgi:DNA-binding MarR family transcriptional regulator
VQRLVNEMQDDELVQLAPNPHHQRAKLVVLSLRGKTAFAGAMKRQTAWANELANGVTAREIATAAAMLRRLRQRLERMENGQRSARQPQSATKS